MPYYVQCKPAGPAPGQFLATGDPVPFEYTGEFRNAHSFDTFEQANSFCDAQDDNVVVAVPAKADVLVTNLFTPLDHTDCPVVRYVDEKGSRVFLVPYSSDAPETVRQVCDTVAAAIAPSGGEKTAWGFEIRFSGQSEAKGRNGLFNLHQAQMSSLAPRGRRLATDEAHHYLEFRSKRSRDSSPIALWLTRDDAQLIYGLLGAYLKDAMKYHENEP